MTAWKPDTLQPPPSSDSSQGSQAVVVSDDSRAREVSVTPTLEPTRTRVYEIRALETKTELYDSYQLRYDVYGALGYLQGFNRSRLEVDIYDRSSVPFGAFDARTCEMIGTLRLITAQPQPAYQALIESVLAECMDTELNTQASAPSGLRLPAISCEEINRELARFNQDHFTVHELSRFIVRPGHRYSQASRALVQLAMARAMLSGPAVFIAGCLPRHVRLYASYGFGTLPNSGLHQFDSVGQRASTIVCRSDALPPLMQDQVNGLLRAMTIGAPDHTLALSRDARARFCFRDSAPRNPGSPSRGA